MYHKLIKMESFQGYKQELGAELPFAPLKNLIPSTQETATLQELSARYTSWRSSPPLPGLINPKQFPV